METKKIDNNLTIKPLSKSKYVDRTCEYPLPCPLSERPFLWIILAPTGSGKSVLVSNLLKKFYKKVFNKIYFCSSNVDEGIIKDKAYEKVKLSPERIFNNIESETIEKIFKEVKKDDNFDDEDFCSLLIIDDLATDLNNPSLIKQLLRQRHDKISVIIISHKLHTLIPTPIRGNATHWSVFKTRNEKDVKDLIELTPLKEKDFNQIYDYATKNQYNFLFINMLYNPQKYFKNFDEEIILNE